MALVFTYYREYLGLVLKNMVAQRNQPPFFGLKGDQIDGIEVAILPLREGAPTNIIKPMENVTSSSKSSPFQRGRHLHSQPKNISFQPSLSQESVALKKRRKLTHTNEDMDSIVKKLLYNLLIDF